MNMNSCFRFHRAHIHAASLWFITATLPGFVNRLAVVDDFGRLVEVDIEATRASLS